MRVRPPNTPPATHRRFGRHNFCAAVVSPAEETPVNGDHGLTADDVVRMKRETENARRDYKVIETTHWDNCRI